MNEQLAIALLSIPPILLALTAHEYAHGYAALKMGDPTAKFAGRLTFNPIRHVDLLGLIMFVLFRFGWAKPVPMNPRNFRDIRKGMIVTSLAGPLSNLGLAMLFGFAIRLLTLLHAGGMGTPLWLTLQLGLLYNLILCAFNLIPIPPLDGSHVLFSLLPPRFLKQELWLQRYGFYVLFGLIILDRTGIPVLWGWIGPFVVLFSNLFAGPFGLVF